MGNTTRNIAVGGALAIVLSIVIFGVIGTPTIAQGDEVTGNTIQKTPNLKNGDYQKVKLTFVNYEYRLEPSTLQKGVPVRMEVDLDSVYGCMRNVVIPSVDVRKYVKEGDNIIEFTPDKAGTFNIRCSMNMGRGKFTVVEGDGSTSSFVEEAAPVDTEGSCGSDSGSCGCSGA